MTYWLKKDAQLTQKLYTAIPLALVSKDKHSTGYRAWNGVKEILKVNPNRWSARESTPLLYTWLTKDVDERNGSIACCSVGRGWVIRVVEAGGQSSDDGKPQRHEERRRDKHLTSTNTIDELCTNDGTDERNDRDNAVKHEPSVVVRDTGLAKHRGQKVRDCSISGPFCSTFSLKDTP